ncbi:hypothetical protein KY327_01475 [Candidatus Woesearchaeota archaeon]|nr:hypothetical protein [Candidatus Woesearchaeota archaeon]
MRNYLLLTLIVLALALGGCSYLGIGDNDTEPTGQIVLDDEDFTFLNETNETAPEDNETLPEAGDNVSEEDVAHTVRITEGELVSLDLQAVDPDGDTLEYEYEAPLNEQGRWQTEIGDEGRYLVTVTVSDGKLATKEDVLVIVERANRAPVINCPDTIDVKEGETLSIDCDIYDEEGDSILVSYEGWARSDTKEIGYEASGEHAVLVRASDGQKENTKEIIVDVEDVNRKPVLKPVQDVTIMETNTVVVEPEVSDPDGDDVTLSFSDPLNDDGTWETDDGDAGTYEVTVTATDGKATVSETFTVTVTQINTAPVLKPIGDIEVDEGETIKLPVNAYDPEGDELTFSYSGFMDGEEYTTTYEDAGEYQQTVTVSDGVLETSETFTIEVNDKNRPPRFVMPGEE